MKHRHTPGPWIVEQDPGTYPGHRVYVQDMTRSDSEDWNGWIDLSEAADTEANARLIAAAPDLLAALRSLLDDYEPSANEKWNVARAAIAKATGSDVAA